MPRIPVLSLVLAIVAIGVALVAAPAASAYDFSSSGGYDITVAAPTPSQRVVTPYAQVITVPSGVIETPVHSVSVVLNNVHHTDIGDLRVLLVSPTGQKIRLLDRTANAAGTSTWPANLIGQYGFTVNGGFQFDGNGDTDSTVFATTDYKPTFPADGFGVGDGPSGSNFPAPAPAGPYTDTLSSVANLDPAGQWTLYVDDAQGGDGGTIGSWTLSIDASASTTSPATVQSGVSLMLPYPVPHTVSGIDGTIDSMRVHLYGLNTTAGDFIDMLLVGPTGASTMLMSDNFRGGVIRASHVIFDPSGSPMPASGATMVDGSVPTTFVYAPSNAAGVPDDPDIFAPPVLANTTGSPRAASFAPFAHTDPNGVWQLYAVNDTGGSTVVSLEHYSIEFAITPTVHAPAPAPAPAPAAPAAPIAPVVVVVVAPTPTLVKVVTTIIRVGGKPVQAFVATASAPGTASAVLTHKVHGKRVVLGSMTAKVAKGRHTVPLTKALRAKLTKRGSYQLEVRLTVGKKTSKVSYAPIVVK